MYGSGFRLAARFGLLDIIYLKLTEKLTEMWEENWPKASGCPWPECREKFASFSEEMAHN